MEGVAYSITSSWKLLIGVTLSSIYLYNIESTELLHVAANVFKLFSFTLYITPYKL